jgi:perosamine synthetase
VVRYLGAVPVLVDCDPLTLNMDLEDCEFRISNCEIQEVRGRRSGEEFRISNFEFRNGEEESQKAEIRGRKSEVGGQRSEVREKKVEVRNSKIDIADVVGIMPVHVGGLMIDVGAVKEFAAKHKLWIVEDAAHAFPAAERQRSEVRGRRSGVGGREREIRNSTPPDRNSQFAIRNEFLRCGEGTGDVTCFSFYANKTITTGEGGMAVTNDRQLAERMRVMSLHGLSQDAWERYSGGSSWDYRIIAPGFKYNLTDIAAAIGIHQLARAEAMRCERERIAQTYLESFADVDEIELPPEYPNRIHAWHLFPIRLRLDKLTIDRNRFIDELKQAGVGCSVHWRPLHLHPYYQETFGWQPEDFPVATAVWLRLISLPIFPGMRADEIEHVVNTVTGICRRYSVPNYRLSMAR